MVEALEELMNFVTDAIFAPGEINSVHAFLRGQGKATLYQFSAQEAALILLEWLGKFFLAVRTQLGQPASMVAAAEPLPKGSEMSKNARSRIERARMLAD